MAYSSQAHQSCDERMISAKEALGFYDDILSALNSNNKAAREGVITQRVNVIPR